MERGNRNNAGKDSSDLENRLFDLLDRMRNDEIERAQREGRKYQIHGLCAVLGYDPEQHASNFKRQVGDDYFSDNEGWENFPVIKTDSSGNWSGDIWGLLVEDKNEGNYKIKIRARKKETDTFSESGFKDLKFSKPAEIVIVATPAAVIKSVEKIATKSAVISVKKSTESAVLSSSISAEVLPPQENKKSQKANPLAVVLGVSGFFLLLFSVWGIIIKRYGSQ